MLCTYGIKIKKILVGREIFKEIGLPYGPP